MTDQPRCIVARFDEQLTVVHLLAEGALPCPRGVIVTKPVMDDNPAAGTYRWVKPCGWTYQHEGPCEPTDKPYVSATVCGIPTTATPWVIGPEDAEKCRACFGLPAHVEDALEFAS